MRRMIRIMMVWAIMFAGLIPPDNTGELKGTVTDKNTSEGLYNVAVTLLNADQKTAKAQRLTDFEGNYAFSPLDSGTYYLKIQAAGYGTQVLGPVHIQPQKTTMMNVQMELPEHGEVKIVHFKDMTFDVDNTTSEKTYARQSIQKSPTGISGLVNSVSGTYSNEAGRPGINGSRTYGTQYIVDGIKMTGTPNIPKNSIEDMKVLTGGVPAEYENQPTQTDNTAPPTTTQIQPHKTPVEFNTEEYNPIVENEWKAAHREPLSTFSIDVDKASYSNIRRYLSNGQLPPRDAVRIEEMINYFHYDYPQPRDGHPVSVSCNMAVCPWNTAHRLVHIGLQGRNIAPTAFPASNLVFLIDVSGSMYEENKLPLVKRSLGLLVNQLRKEDRIAMVVYAGAAGLVLPSTSGDQKEKILEAIDGLSAGGSTNGGEGIRLAYDIAKKNYMPDGNNRIILATDGDFNVGVSSDGELEQMIETRRKEGVFLTVLGFGMGNYKDNKMELLADKGNGNYAYIDDLFEAERVLVKEFGGTIFTIAKDVKLQIEWNPALVKGYRLIGYENRLLNEEDFYDDRKDAGELGAGHTVTALYEIIPAGSIEKLPSIDSLKYQAIVQAPSNNQSREVMTLKLRYKLPKDTVSRLLSRILKDSTASFEAADDNLHWAATVAAFGLTIRGSKFKGSSTLGKVEEWAKTYKGPDTDGDRAEFIKMVRMAGSLSKK